MALYQKATFALNVCHEITIVSRQVTMSLLLNNLKSSTQLIRVTNADNLQNITAVSSGIFKRRGGGRDKRSY